MLGYRTSVPILTREVCSLYLNLVEKHIFKTKEVPDVINNLILNYSRQIVSIRITRPLKAGTSNDMHHLHIKQLQLLSFKVICVLIHLNKLTFMCQNGLN